MKWFVEGARDKNQIQGPSFDSQTSCSFSSQLESCDGKVENTQQKKEKTKLEREI